MNAEDSKKASLKQKAVHELEEMLAIFLYLGFFFCAISTYSMLLLDRFQVLRFHLWRRADQRAGGSQGDSHRRVRETGQKTRSQATVSVSLVQVVSVRLAGLRFPRRGRNN